MFYFKNKKKLAKIKAKDLHDVEINTEIIPVVLKGEKFDYSKFYGVILMAFRLTMKFI